YDIQGSSHTSAYDGQQVTTTGVVTATDSNAVFVQNALGDGNNATSDAIYIYTGTGHGLQIGDAVRVSGVVSEYVPGGSSSGNLSLTEFYRPDITVESNDNMLPEPVILGRSGRVPPNQVIDNDLLANFDPQLDGIDFYESLEGMLVKVEDAVAVSPTNRYGEIFTLANNGVDATGRNDRGGITI
ncbi:MAG: hypothetical protein ABW138_05495, partial [Candidatus Thiodiazotropha sp. 4PDIVS1]